MKVSDSIKQSYASQYDQNIVEWRTIAAKYKAKNIVGLAKNIQFDSVIEVGCGEGSILSWLSKWGFSKNLYGIDISESGISVLKSKEIESLKEALLFDGYTIPYPDNHFDLAICSHVMEHVEHERVLLREIKRVSKFQIFEVPIDFSFYVDKKLKHFLAYGHLNIYTPALFRFMLLTENFRVIADKKHFFSNDILDFIYEGKPLAKMFAKIKRSILKLFPYLGGIKPQAYCVLTEGLAGEISIL